MFIVARPYDLINAISQSSKQKQYSNTSNSPALRSGSSLPKQLAENNESSKFKKSLPNRLQITPIGQLLKGSGVSSTDHSMYGEGNQRALDSKHTHSILGKCRICGVLMYCGEGETEVICFCGNRFEISAQEPFPQTRRTALLVNPEGKRSTYEFIEGKPSIMGLRNLGLSCYMNSALNSLYFVPPFYQYFSNLPKSSTKGLASYISFFAKIVEFEKGMKIYLKINTVLILKNVGVYLPDEDDFPLIFINPNNIE